MGLEGDPSLLTGSAIECFFELPSPFTTFMCTGRDGCLRVLGDDDDSEAVLGGGCLGIILIFVDCGLSSVQNESCH